MALFLKRQSVRRRQREGGKERETEEEKGR